ncbi:hypothetical protein [Cellulomonas sp. S1-8]|uniref:hypothetical protein n=1 Tax=Cellulomonas sp. S1-8 TaxID=2904790 RepID=UPI002244B0C9|nr:hypothetical protein [Cellulomonas sp. S1-8]UZN02405.1 hypothetical protein OKX07_15280 [Cellulomonas sp. S1-8]
MHTYLRQALPGMLVGGGLTLAATGLTAAGEQMLPGALLMVIGGAAAQLYQHLNRPRLAVPAPRVVLSPARRVVRVPTQRAALGHDTPSPWQGAPEPRTTYVEHPALGAPLHGHAAGPLRSLPTWRDVARPGTQGAGLRHCVRPHGSLRNGELPHQRRAADGS